MPKEAKASKEVTKKRKIANVTTVSGPGLTGGSKFTACIQ
jgi:hypothetical protein